jgi:hypothetical protein
MAAKRKPKPKTDPIESLTVKQRLFVSYYLGAANGNATEAARMAGYSNAEIGRQLLRNITIRSAIEAKLAGPAMAADEVLARLSDMASADMADFTDEDPDGGFRLNLTKARRAGRLHLVKALRPTQFGIGVVLHDAQAALEKLGKYHALWQDRPADDGPPPGRPRLRIPDDDDRFGDDQVGPVEGEAD